MSTTRRLYCVFVEEVVEDAVEDERVDDVADGVDAGSDSAKPRFSNESGAMRLLCRACSLAQSFQCANGAGVRLHPDRHRYQKVVYDRNGERYGFSDPDNTQRTPLTYCQTRPDN